jgi:hypothetical protein
MKSNSNSYLPSGNNPTSERISASKSRVSVAVPWRAQGMNLLLPAPPKAGVGDLLAPLKAADPVEAALRSFRLQGGSLEAGERGYNLSRYD